MLTLVDSPIASESVPSPRAADASESVNRQSWRRHCLYNVNFDAFDDVEKAADAVIDAARVSPRGVSVYTCNVDHLMMMRRDSAFKDAYVGADIVTIDGAPVAKVIRWTGTSTAQRVTGVDLTSAMIAVAARARLRVALVGGLPGRGAEAAQRVVAENPGLPQPFVASPAMGFTLYDEEDRDLVSSLKAYRPDIIVVCLGAPRQELWIAAHREQFAGAVLIGAGATVDFLSGHLPRAPRIFRRTGTEAVYRLAKDFRRLWRRYLLRDLTFLALCPGLFIGTVLARCGLASGGRSHAIPTIETGDADAISCPTCCDMELAA